MVADRAARGARADPRVRRVRLDELDVLYPACVAMFTEEVGVSPGGATAARLPRPGGRAGRAGAGRSRGSRTARCVFKAEIGAETAQACQLQGV